MKLPKAYLNHIDKLTKLFQAKMLLMEYDITTKHVDKISGSRYHDGYSAEVETDTRYLEVKIKTSGKLFRKWKKKEYRELAETICHELAHVYTDPYYEHFWDVVPKKQQKQLMHINEQQTERIARLVMLNVRPEEYLP